MTTYALRLKPTAVAVGIAGLPIFVGWEIVAQYLGEFKRPAVEGAIPGFKVPMISDWRRLLPRMAIVHGENQRGAGFFACTTKEAVEHLIASMGGFTVR